MVSVLERYLLFGGIGAFYAYSAISIFTSRKKTNNILHQSLIQNSQKFITETNHPHLKFIELPQERALFIIGIENNKNDLATIELIEEIVKNFNPNAFFYERNIEQ